MERLADEEAEDLVAASLFGHLALADGGRACCVPLHYGFRDGRVYFHAQAGLREEYARGRKDACFTVTRFDGEAQWRSVQAFGALSESHQGDRDALDALLKAPLPSGFVLDDEGRPAHGEAGMRFWCLQIRRLEGVRNAAPANEAGIHAV